MGARYKNKDEAQLGWEDAKDSARVVLRQLYRRLDNFVINQLSVAYDAAEQRGELAAFRPDEAMIAAHMATYSKQLAIEALAGDEDN